MIELKTPGEIDAVAAAGHVVASILATLHDKAAPGVTPHDLDLIANADLAVATGVPRERTIIAEDGSVVDLQNGRARIVGKVDASYIFVDGSTVVDVSVFEYGWGGALPSVAIDLLDVPTTAGVRPPYIADPRAVSGGVALGIAAVGGLGLLWWRRRRFRGVTA